MKNNIRNLSLFTVFAMTLFATPVFASTFTVDFEADFNDASPGNGRCAGGPGGCSLRAAIEEANALAGDDIIMLPAGTFLLNNVGVGENSAVTGDLDITSNISIYGAGADETIIDGNATDRVFSVLSGGGSPVVNISHLTVTNGKAQNFIDSSGGAFYITAGTVSLDALSIRNNASSDGVAIDGFPFGHGTVAAGDGGAILSANTNLVIRNSTISGNRTGDGANGWDTPAVATDGSSSGNGAGIYAVSGTISIFNSTISGNSTGNAGRGGNNFGAPGKNGANAGSGAGIFAANSVTLTLNNVTLAKNTAGGGGAGGSGGADADGLHGEDGDAGGIFISDLGAGAVVHISNSIIAGNSIGLGGEGPDCFGLFTSADHSLIQDPNECDAYVVGDNGNLSADPLFDAAGLFNNGGATQTIALLVASPAVNAGFADTCESLDQRGVARSGTCDMGAFEYEAICGDAVVQDDEECDDGNNDEADSCDNSCVDTAHNEATTASSTSVGSSGGGCSLSKNSPQRSGNMAFAFIALLFAITYLASRRARAVP